MSFRTEQISLLATSGWCTCRSVADAVAAAGLPAITAEYLDTAFSADQWRVAELAVSALHHRFAGARFAEEADYGVLLIPDPERLDTRAPMDPAVRRDQLGTETADVFDDRLPAGRLGVSLRAAWSMVATVTGRYGISMGSYRDVTGADKSAFTVNGVDARELMTRQVWGARVLQSGPNLPDCEANERWTFTLFAGEDLTDGLAESGTVLKGRVRFRLGKPDRGIGSARIAPTIAIP